MVWIVAALLLLVVFVTLFFLRGENLSAWDSPLPERDQSAPASDAHHDVVASMGELSGMMAGGGSRKDQLKAMREYLDEMGKDVPFDGEIIPVNTDTVKGEWVVAPGADPARRMLYILSLIHI